MFFSERGRQHSSIVFEVQDLNIIYCRIVSNLTGSNLYVRQCVLLFHDNKACAECSPVSPDNNNDKEVSIASAELLFFLHELSTLNMTERSCRITRSRCLFFVQRFLRPIYLPIFEVKGNMRHVFVYIHNSDHLRRLHQISSRGVVPRTQKLRPPSPLPLLGAQGAVAWEPWKPWNVEHLLSAKSAGTAIRFPWLFLRT